MTSIDRPFLGITYTLVVAGFFIFSSASLGLLARDGATFSSVAFSQIVFGLVGGTFALFVFSRVNYRVLRRFAPHIFVVTLLLTLLVFVPGVGISHGGATRWLNIFGFSVQPSELLKIGYILGLGWFLTKTRAGRTDPFRDGLVPFVALSALAGGVLLLQPDTGTFLVIGASGVAMYLAAGAQMKHLGVLFSIACVGLMLLVAVRPYILDRITTYLEPGSDPRGSGYQIRQSLIAIGAGGWFGRGYGQSIQKFGYLPEPIGDSVYSVAVEEFGFLGGVLLVVLYVAFALRGFQIATRAPDRFGGLVVVGVVILIISQSFANIGSMLGVVPLTGEPLAFISHGGTALLGALAAVGIVLNISRHTVSTVPAKVYAKKQ